jgi:arginine deiminase
MLGEEPPTLAEELIWGVRVLPVPRGAVEARELFRVSPLPNWCFQRDPLVVLDQGVLHCAMASPARFREAVLARALFRFHPDLAGVPVVHDPALGSAPGEETLEGGDVVVISPELVVVGLSERTSREGILSLARSLADAGSARWLLAVKLPRRRAYMHLDTVITPVDRDAALVYPPVIQGDGPEQATVFDIDLTARDLRPVERKGGLLEVLADHGMRLEPIPCGGTDPLRQQREQWTDGANALAVAPGVIVLYERNVQTLAELSRRGFEVVRAKDLVLGKKEWDWEEGGRLCVILPAHELSRARGGPHCLAHPLVRDDP